MTPPFAIPQRAPAWARPTSLVIASLATCLAALIASPAGAASARGERRVEEVASRAAGAPILAIVSLRSQRVTVYDADGWILRAPVSSGQKGRETPAGIFSVIQKQAEHYSNLYDDAFMPHMQRITWSGIALHGGPLPGHAASHGCIRMPYDFAARLFEETRVGMRVIVSPGDATPVEIAHPALFAPKADATALAAARAAEANEAVKKADQARLAATKATRDAARLTMPVRVAENLKPRAAAQLAAAESALVTASPDAKEQAEDARQKAAARVAEVEAQVTAAKAELEPALDAATAAREALASAEAARGAAAQASRDAARDLEPVSVFVSRKTQRLYVRRAFQPVLESPVEIKDADRPIGTHIFTAVARTSGDALRWSVVSLEGSHGAVVEADAQARGTYGQNVERSSTDTAGAKSALDRIVIPQDVLDRIAAMASPRSSLIVSDEGVSTETGAGTDFVVLLSGEPQGGIKFRRRTPDVRYVRRQPLWGWPFAGRW